MPVCRLLRVHSTGLTSLHDPNRRQQFLEEHSQLETRQVRPEAVVHALAETQVRIRFTRDVEGIGVDEHRRVAIGRTLPDLHFLTRSIALPAQLARPGRGAPLRRRRRRPSHHLLDGGRRRCPRSARNAWNWSGWSSSASSPPATALRVVSAPALNSRLKNRYRSMSDSATQRPRPRRSRSRPPTACRRSARPASTRSAPARRCTSASRPPRRDSCPIDALREPPKSNCGSIASNSQCRSDSGTPSRMQIICIGSSAATSVTKVERLPRRHFVEQPARPRPQVVLDAVDHPRCQT